MIGVFGKKRKFRRINVLPFSRIEEEEVEVQADGCQRDDGPDDAESPNVDGLVGEFQLLSRPCQKMDAGEEEFVCQGVFHE